MTIGDIRKIKKFLSLFDFCTITESFSEVHITYDVELLVVWLDNGVVGFGDYNDIILTKDNSIAKGFLLLSAEVIFRSSDQIAIKLKDGIITINGLK